VMWEEPVGLIEKFLRDGVKLANFRGHGSGREPANDV
jgi:hypothetical protein